MIGTVVPASGIALGYLLAQSLRVVVLSLRNEKIYSKGKVFKRDRCKRRTLRVNNTANQSVGGCRPPVLPHGLHHSQSPWLGYARQWT
jgi:hypothetical protein